MEYLIVFLLVSTLFSRDSIMTNVQNQNNDITIQNVQNFIEYMCKQLVDKPDEVKVNSVETEKQVIYELVVGVGDYGKVIGKRGRNISALRTLVRAINAKQGGKWTRLDVIDQ